MDFVNLNSKSLARIAAIQSIYQISNNEFTDINTILMRIIEFYKDKDVITDHELDSSLNIKFKPSYGFLKELTTQVHTNISEIDEIIKSLLSSDWDINSLPKLLISTLRVSVGELKYYPETPKNIIISQYTDIASDMLDDKEVGFVNSLLENFAKNMGR